VEWEDAMSTYRVEVVKAELVGLWRAYWEDDDPSARTRMESQHGSLDMAVEVEASDAEEAASTAERQNPGYIAIGETAQRLHS
jgi:hypothetical protein